jgi:hypothetical protein
LPEELRLLTIEEKQTMCWTAPLNAGSEVQKCLDRRAQHFSAFLWSLSATSSKHGNKDVNLDPRTVMALLDELRNYGLIGEEEEFGSKFDGHTKAVMVANAPWEGMAYGHVRPSVAFAP